VGEEKSDAKVEDRTQESPGRDAGSVARIRYSPQASSAPMNAPPGM
jgi:hypothetical protein